MPVAISKPFTKMESAGLRSQAAIAELDSIWDSRAVHFVVDYEKSSGV